jgi:hypothetical protein
MTKALGMRVRPDAGRSHNAGSATWDFAMPGFEVENAGLCDLSPEDSGSSSLAS